MQGYDPTNASYDSIAGSEQGFMTRVFNWMFIGLLITAAVSFFLLTNPALMQAFFSNQLLFWGAVIGEFILVINLSANINKMSAGAAAMNFAIYSALNGLTLSVIFVIYELGSIFTVFCITAATFAAMAIYGATTKKDLTNWGSIAFMALIGLIIAQLVNVFLHIQGLAMILNYIGVLVFVALTAYDVQKIKQIGQSNNYNPNMAILGALRLYLDFINLFIYLLRIFGRRK